MAAVKAGVVRPPKNMVIIPNAMMVVYARMLFKSVCTSASTDPHNAVAAPTITSVVIQMVVPPQHRMKSDKQVYTSLHHCSGMKKCANRGRRFHGVGQPEMKRELRGFGKCAD